MPPRKVALVTGGSAGLGAAIARLLARDLHMSVIINYSQNESRASDLVRELQEAQVPKDGLDPPVFKAIQADLHSKPAVARLVEEAVAATGGRLDVVVSNFGWTKMTNFADLEEGVDEEMWDMCFNANVKSHLWLFYAARRYLEEANEREEGAAVFVSTASTAGVKPAGSSLVWGCPAPALWVFVAN
ncbi:SDR family NAD(P)-dependent oxidoreductase [Candidatus Bathyarchaeota archaeon]|nr:SDR family NAD(P)-dependent oxidoreductase [Candidatus Bathyarchaeota archaeon]